MTKTLEEIVELANVAAIENLMNRKPGATLAPVILGFDVADATHVFLFQMPPPGAKGIGAQIMRHQLQIKGCDRYAFVSEIWFSKEAAKARVPSREANDRQDGLQILAASREVAIARNYAIRPIDQTPGIELVQLNMLDSRKPGHGIGGLWAQLLAPKFDLTGKTGYFNDQGWNAGNPMETVGDVTVITADTPKGE